jgi:hypothetical protein
LSSFDKYYIRILKILQSGRSYLHERLVKRQICIWLECYVFFCCIETIKIYVSYSFWLPKRSAIVLVPIGVLLSLCILGAYCRAHFCLKKEQRAEVNIRLYRHVKHNMFLKRRVILRSFANTVNRHNQEVRHTSSGAVSHYRDLNPQTRYFHDVRNRYILCNIRFRWRQTLCKF